MVTITEAQSRIMQANTNGYKGLDLSGLGLTSLPTELWKLKGLRSLDLHNNNLPEITEEIKSLELLEILNVSINKITHLPNGIGALINLKQLDANYNRIVNLPESIGKLTNLSELSLRGNELEHLPDTLAYLFRLFILDLRDNKFNNFPKSVLQSKALNDIIVSHFFAIDSLKSTLFRSNGRILISGNPIADVPPEIMRQGMEAVRTYFTAQGKSQTRRLYEAKLLIVGEPGAGKTTLSKKIQNPNADMPKPESTTRGISVEQHTFQTRDGNNFKINIWDFAGQEIYSATHRFFLTKRSVYALLTDNRRESENFNYWLNIVEVLSEKSPLLIIQNERDNRKKDLAETGMKSRFDNIKDVLACNLLDNRGLPEVISSIEHFIQNLPFVGMTLRKEWVDVRIELERLAAKGTPYIEERDFYKICKEHNIDDRVEARTWATLLHDLGVLLHFQNNPLLRRYMFLSPPWATSAVYRVVDSREIQEQNGFFTKADAAKLWQGNYYDDMHDELLALMAEFKICFPLDGIKNRFVIPQHLRGKPEAFQWDAAGEVQLRLDYRFLPKGVFHQFMVEMHRFLEDANSLAWDTGALFRRDEAIAWVEEIYDANQIGIRIRGQQKQAFLDRIIEQFDAIREQYPGLEVDKKIPCRCDTCKSSEVPYLFDYKILKRRLKAGKTKVECQSSFHELEMVQLLGDYFTQDKINRDAYGRMLSGQPRIFISYAHKNEDFKNEFREMVAPFENNGKWKVWDDRYLLPGDDWNREIIRHLEEAHVAVLLLTPAFFKSDFIYHEELRHALDRNRREELLLLGVLVGDCLYEETPLREIQILPKDGLPIDRSPNRSQVWKEVALKINETIEFWQGKQIR